MAAESKPIQTSGLASLVNDFDLFLIDQFGVLHNGIAPYPGAVDTLEWLKSKKKHVVIISNSGKRASVNVDRLASLGFSDNLFDHVVTSGEVAYYRLARRLDGSTTKSCFLIARDNDQSATSGLSLRLVNDAAAADMIIISASEAERYNEDDYTEQLSDAAKRDIDKKMLTSTGLQFGAGRIAEIYESLGGTVEWIGKPHPAIYQHCLSLHSRCDNERVLCIGDSIEHDIVGGRSVNLKTLLVMTGIIAGVTSEELRNQIAKYSANPDYIADRLAI